MTYEELKSALELAARRRNWDILEGDIALFILSGFYAVDAALGWTKAEKTIVSVVGQPNYAVNTALRSLEHVIYYDASETRNFVLADIPFYDYLGLREDKLSNATPKQWAQYGPDIWLSPPPDTASDTIKMYGTVEATALSLDADEPTFPKEYHRLIVDYAIILAYVEYGELPQSAEFEAMFQRLIDRIASSAQYTRHSTKRTSLRGA